MKKMSIVKGPWQPARNSKKTLNLRLCAQERITYSWRPTLWTNLWIYNSIISTYNPQEVGRECYYCPEGMEILLTSILLSGMCTYLSSQRLVVESPFVVGGAPSTAYSFLRVPTLTCFLETPLSL